MAIGSSMFAVFINYSELWVDGTFPDMASGSYWAFITMTTVGYGDMFPKGHQGKIVAVFCAITGTICTGMPIPIIANNFSLFYSYARTRISMTKNEEQEKIEKSNKENKKKVVKAARNLLNRNVMRVNISEIPSQENSVATQNTEEDTVSNIELESTTTEGSATESQYTTCKRGTPAWSKI